ncbi:MAG: GNAT family N-acetyltransferase [Cellvibrionaceae bacterium]
MRARFIDSIHLISSDTWNQLCGLDYPFLRHEFFAALEDSKSTTRETGWQAHHLIVEDDERVLLVMPLFLKHHSYGEYVFDWSWADAFHRHGEQYYPKLLNAIPFTPATGPRWGIVNSDNTQQTLLFALETIEQEVKAKHYSSSHFLFLDLLKIKNDQSCFQQHSYCKRTGSQYHWLNDGYCNFDDFLSHFSSRKRKNLKKERQKVKEQNIELVVKEADSINEEDWQHFFLFYHMTYFKRSGRQGYLTEAFFPLLASTLKEKLMMVQAIKDDEVIAAALYFKDSHTLYGRYWGCKEEYDQLHFEACYYQGIEYAIKQKLQKFDPGAQGEHKIQRGFTPIETYSYHWINHPQFHHAIDRFVRTEEKEIKAYIKEASKRLPFKAEL